MTKVIGISVGLNGTVWCVDSAGNAYMRVGYNGYAKHLKPGDVIILEA
jgi:hypothetical protein